eukprot:scaffold94771_cov14-Tisochrysis_lutea.AAC.1
MAVPQMLLHSHISSQKPNDFSLCDQARVSRMQWTPWGFNFTLPTAFEGLEEHSKSCCLLSCKYCTAVKKAGINN